MNVLGLGFRKNATLKSFENALNATNLIIPLDAVAVPIDKSDHPNFVIFAEEIGVTILKISQLVIGNQQTPTQSQIVQYFRQSGSVAEATALAGAGKNSRLIVERVISNDGCVAAAIACSHIPISKKITE